MNIRASLSPIDERMKHLNVYSDVTPREHWSPRNQAAFPCQAFFESKNAALAQALEAGDIGAIRSELALGANLRGEAFFSGKDMGWGGWVFAFTILTNQPLAMNYCLDQMPRARGNARKRILWIGKWFGTPEIRKMLRQWMPQ